jgi:hypothetical protein
MFLRGVRPRDDCLPSALKRIMTDVSDGACHPYKKEGERSREKILREFFPQSVSAYRYDEQWIGSGD